ncbi:hypothetical protein B0H14DRAFT_2727406 [Mycena olivaceomarginata]|nr:hypothetical protein B0H14DRAFT_2727406 [Mycena olivaceomarginata]
MGLSLLPVLLLPVSVLLLVVPLVPKAGAGDGDFKIPHLHKVPISTKFPSAHRRPQCVRVVVVVVEIRAMRDAIR